jgi:hypothetical protein
MDHYYDDEDENDSRIVRDGETVRVSMFAMDSTQREIAARFPRSRALYQPSFVSDVETAFDQEAALDAQERRDLERAQLSALWKGGLEPGDRIRMGDRMVEVGDRNPDTGKIRLHDAEVETWEDAETLKQQAYDAYDRELENAWRTNDD